MLPLQQTGSWLHTAPLPVPMTLIGLQPIPTEPSTGSRAMFNALVILLNELLLEAYVVWQHETVPVLHCAPELQVLLSRADRVGTAVDPTMNARRETRRTERANMFVGWGVKKR